MLTISMMRLETRILHSIYLIQVKMEFIEFIRIIRRVNCLLICLIT
nr:MAG TPA: hypothetical protein [Caudoviricetes sp.]